MNESITRLFGVSGKHVVVTGGSRGIGRMIAQGFVEAGATVYITARKADACDATAAELSEFGTCHSFPGDLSTEEGIATFAARVGEHTDQLHVLVNNAGATWGAPIDDYPAESWDKVFDINVRGAFLLTKALLPSLRAAGTADDPARVINIGSIDGIRVPAMESYAYSSSKAAIHMLTRHLATKLAPDITVNAIAPGPFESKMMSFALDNPDIRSGIESSTPRGRIGHPDDMAGASIFLASRAGAYVTGVILPVDGGIRA